MNESSKNSVSEISQEEFNNCLQTLEKMALNNELLMSLPEEQRIKLLIATGKISRPDRYESKQRNKVQKNLSRLQNKNNERLAVAETAIRKARESTLFVAPAQLEDEKRSQLLQNSRTLKNPRKCYVCKEEFTQLHFFYDSMCMKCAEFNYAKRFQTASLQGKTAIITGSRLKIGYQAALMMLRAGARVIATTRFPIDSAQRFSKEPDFQDWKDRLQIFGLDLRHTPSVELFCTYMEHHLDRLDIIINNAAQTVRRPPGFYKHLMDRELQDFSTHDVNVQELLNMYTACKNHLLTYTSQGNAEIESNLPISWNGNNPGIGIRASAQLSQIPYSYDNSLPVEQVFPSGKLDADLQQVDLRKTNSWRYRLGEEEIPTTEMLEIQLVNAIAPFVICNRLIPLMKKDFTGQKHVVNVSAMEGKFLKWKKGDRHPHTNMAKAALNMLTHTSSEGLEKYGIYMNAVDTGWVTDEDPVELSKFKQEVHDFQPPLDIVDGAARVCDPFFDGILTGKHWCGKFLKDYFPIDW